MEGLEVSLSPAVGDVYQRSKTPKPAQERVTLSRKDVGDYVVFVGDVHGCADETLALLQRAPPNSTVIFVGDLVHKGPKSAEAVSLARKWGYCVRGNHDDSFLAAYYRRGKYANGIDAYRFPELVGEMDPGDTAWLTQCPIMISVPFLSMVVVHAGLVPGVGLDKQRFEDMLWMRDLRAFRQEVDGDESARDRVDGQLGSTFEALEQPGDSSLPWARVFSEQQQHQTALLSWSSSTATALGAENQNREAPPTPSSTSLAVPPPSTSGRDTARLAEEQRRLGDMLTIKLAEGVEKATVGQQQYRGGRRVSTVSTSADSATSLGVTPPNTPVGGSSADHGAARRSSFFPARLEVVFGHDAVRGLQEEAAATGLDTGCCYGGCLTGLVVNANDARDRYYLQVQAKRQYSEKKGTGGGSGEQVDADARPTKFPVHYHAYNAEKEDWDADPIVLRPDAGKKVGKTEVGDDGARANVEL